MLKANKFYLNKKNDIILCFNYVYMNNNNEKTLEEKMQAMMVNPQQNAGVNEQEEQSESLEELEEEQFSLNLDESNNNVSEHTNNSENAISPVVKQYNYDSEEENEIKVIKNGKFEEDKKNPLVSKDKWGFSTPPKKKKHTKKYDEDKKEDEKEEDKKDAKFSKKDINKSKSPKSPSSDL